MVRHIRSRKLRVWTREMDAAVRKAHPTNEMSGMIARRLGVTPDSLNRRFQRLGLGPRLHIKAVAGQHNAKVLAAYRAQIKEYPKPFVENYNAETERHLAAVLAADPRGFPCCADGGGRFWPLMERR